MAVTSGLSRLITDAQQIRAKWDENGEPMTLVAAAADAVVWLWLMERKYDDGTLLFQDPLNIERMRGCHRALKRFLTPAIADEQPKTGDQMTQSERLRKYNRWRRGEEDWSEDGRGPDPTELGKLIDAAADRLERLEREKTDEHF